MYEKNRRLDIKKFEHYNWWKKLTVSRLVKNWSKRILKYIRKKREAKRTLTNYGLYKRVTIICEERESIFNILIMFNKHSIRYNFERTTHWAYHWTIITGLIWSCILYLYSIKSTFSSISKLFKPISIKVFISR